MREVPGLLLLSSSPSAAEGGNGSIKTPRWKARERGDGESGQPLHKLCNSPRCHCLFIYPLSIWVGPCIKLIPPAAFCLVEQAQSPVKCLWKAGDCVCGAPGVLQPSASLYLLRTDGIRGWKRGWMTLLGWWVGWGRQAGSEQFGLELTCKYTVTNTNPCKLMDTLSPSHMHKEF